MWAILLDVVIVVLLLWFLMKLFDIGFDKILDLLKWGWKREASPAGLTCILSTLILVFLFMSTDATKIALSLTAASPDSHHDSAQLFAHAAIVMLLLNPLFLGVLYLAKRPESPK